MWYPCQINTAGLRSACAEDPLYCHQRYRKIKDLNEGTFGTVLLALDVRSNQQVAMLAHAGRSSNVFLWVALRMQFCVTQAA